MPTKAAMQGFNCGTNLGAQDLAFGKVFGVGNQSKANFLPMVPRPLHRLAIHAHRHCS